MGSSLDEAVEVAMALGPAAELIRVNEEEGEAKRDEIAAALRELLGGWVADDGTVLAGASAWLVTALNPG